MLSSILDPSARVLGRLAIGSRKRTDQSSHTAKRTFLIKL